MQRNFETVPDNLVTIIDCVQVWIHSAPIFIPMLHLNISRGYTRLEKLYKSSTLVYTLIKVHSSGSLFYRLVWNQSAIMPYWRYPCVRFDYVFMWFIHATYYDYHTWYTIAYYIHHALCNCICKGYINLVHQSLIWVFKLIWRLSNLFLVVKLYHFVFVCCATCCQSWIPVRGLGCVHSPL